MNEVEIDKTKRDLLEIQEFCDEITSLCRCIERRIYRNRIYTTSENKSYCQECLNYIMNFIDLNADDEHLSHFWVCVKCGNATGLKRGKTEGAKEKYDK